MKWCRVHARLGMESFKIRCSAIDLLLSKESSPYNNFSTISAPHRSSRCDAIVSKLLELAFPPGTRKDTLGKEIEINCADSSTDPPPGAPNLKGKFAFARH